MSVLSAGSGWNDNITITRLAERGTCAVRPVAGIPVSSKQGEDATWPRPLRLPTLAQRDTYNSNPAARCTAKEEGMNAELEKWIALFDNKVLVGSATAREEDAVQAIVDKEQS